MIEKRTSAGTRRSTNEGRATKRSSDLDTCGRKASVERCARFSTYCSSRVRSYINIQAWKKRWFVLRSAHLVYYKNSAEYKLLQLLDLGDIHTCTPVTLKKHDNAFCIVSPKRTYYLQAGTPQEVQEWVKAVNRAREDLQLTSTVTEGMVTASSTAPIPVPRKPGESNRSPSNSPYGQGITSSDSEAEGSTPALRSLGISPERLVVRPPGKDGSKPVLSGYLMKCGSRRSASWHHRWFVLAEDKLTYSRSHMARISNTIRNDLDMINEELRSRTRSRIVRYRSR